MVAVQCVLPQERNSVAMALLVFSQTFGGAFFLTVTQTVFANSLSSQLTKDFPGPRASEIIAAGASGIRNVAFGDDLAIVLQAYSDSIDNVFYVGLAVSLSLFVTGWGMGWHDVRTKKSGEVQKISAAADVEKASAEK